MRPKPPEMVAEAIRLARAEAERLDRRGRLLTMCSATGLVVVSLRAVVGVLVPTLHPGGSAVLLAIPLSVGFAACLVGMLVARRWANRLAELRSDICWLDFVQTTLDHGAGFPVLLQPPTAARPIGWPAWQTAGLALAAALAGFAWASFGASSQPDRHRWTFTEQTASVTDLGLVTPVDRAGIWRLEDHEHATGGRALVNHAGHPNEDPALAVTGTLRARDVRAATRCKVQPPATACGVVFRFRDPANHYVARLDAEAGMVSLGVVVHGTEVAIQQRAADIPGGVWQEIVVEAHAGKIVVSWNGERVIEVRDFTLTSPGAVGLWVPSDGVALFDELSVEPSRNHQ